MEEKDYIFKNAFVFVESGNLKNDLYRAFKDEIGYFLEAKHKVYFKELCEKFSKDEQYYKDLTDLLYRLKNVMQDSDTTSLKDYLEEYKFQVKIGAIGKAEESKMQFSILTLRKFDEELDKFAYDVIERAQDKGLETKYGVYHLLKDYFKLEDKKLYNKFEDFLDNIYSIVFETLKLKYGEKKYGKKI